VTGNVSADTLSVEYGTLNVQSTGTLTINTSLVANAEGPNGVVELSGGTIVAPNGLSIPSGLTLTGKGRIAGTVVVGSGTGTSTFLMPGLDGVGTLTIQKKLTFNSDSIYDCDLSTTKRRSDQVAAKGVRINNGAQFSLISVGNRRIPAGTVFTVISNTAATPIAGTFSNLADGSTLMAGPNTLLVSYEGGTGNDLTFTVQ
jgi:hypothetical protein